MSAVIAVTMGDPAGIGPEIIIKALQAPQSSIFKVFGVRRIFERMARQLECPLPERGVEWVDVGGIDTEDFSFGRSDVMAGKLQVSSLQAALDAVMAGQAHALCTAPITKASARAAGFAFPGHTEYLASRTRTNEVVMMLAGPSLRVVPVTGHLPLKEVPERITRQRVVSCLVITTRALQQDFGVARPRVALAGLNPHAGEQGMLGHEEHEILGPAVEEAATQLSDRGVQAELQGPFPADALFVPPIEFDAVVCCYHDQALVPLKMLHRDEGVNITLGLPIVRTSPAHGSALDIAGQGVARPDSMIAALRMARQLVENR
jgi:4-hydroxythreonine-4-phosphate dehydrogenase